MYKSYISLLIFLLPLILLAQNLGNDLAKINEAYADKSFQVKLQYDWFASYGSTEPIESQTGEIAMKGISYFQQMGATETLFTEAYSVLVHHEEKLVMIQPAIARPDPSQLPDLDSALSMCEEVIFEPYDEEYLSYTFYFREGESQYERFTVIYSKADFLLQKLIFYLPAGAVQMEGITDEPPRYEVTYTKTSLNPTFSPNAFSERRYLAKRGDEFVLNSAYKMYRLANYLPN